MRKKMGVVEGANGKWGTERGELGKRVPYPPERDERGWFGQVDRHVAVHLCNFALTFTTPIPVPLFQCIAEEIYLQGQSA